MKKGFDSNFLLVMVVAVVAIVGIVVMFRANAVSYDGSWDEISGEVARDFGMYKLSVGDKIIVNSVEISLENVGSNKAIVVNVGGTPETIPYGRAELVGGLEITNKKAYYSSKKTARYAILRVIDRSEPSCIDTDGGKRYFIKGSVSGSGPDGSVFRSDTCLEAMGGYYEEGYENMLLEYWCNAGEINTVEYKCPKGCSDGICLGKNSIERV
ncbi:MAG: hypothetical protein PHT54_00145 [Candidatus Nanoarchaeia archaeon]|nr:hypothetical protein [Candidatus Nanoarchaeia archaeon]